MRKLEKNNIDKIIKILKNQDYGVSMLAGFGGIDCDPFKILIATVLSVRAKDKQTIPIVDKIFETYNTPQKIIDAPTEILEAMIRPIGFQHIKTQRIKELSKKLVDEFNSVVPNSEKELLSLPGVGRKVANCVLVYSFDKLAIPVDIHVHRISNRIGLVKTKTPEQTETELEKIVPKKYWKDINENFVLHGQNICKPINPICGICKIKPYCKQLGVVIFL